jgi:hypothetical protein
LGANAATLVARRAPMARENFIFKYWLRYASPTDKEVNCRDWLEERYSISYSGVELSYALKVTLDTGEQR